MAETSIQRGSEDRAAHHAPIVRRPEDHPGHAGRFANVTRMVFHPTPKHPNEPNAGIVTYAPGAGFPRHKHDFAQLWYVLEGECRFGEHRLRAGDMVYMEDPHFEHEMRTETGCTIVFMQYPGPTTGARPVYQGRFDGRDAAQGEEERRLRLVAYREGAGAVIEFFVASRDENVQDRLALLGDEPGEAPAEEEVSLRLLRRLASSVRHQQYRGMDVVTVRVARPPPDQESS